MNPEVTITLDGNRETFAAGETVSGAVRLSVPAEVNVAKVELSILWHTEGKGDEDRRVVHQETFGQGEDLRYREQRFSSSLPLLPLTYYGHLIKIHWLVRVRLHLRWRRDVIVDRPFVLRAREREPENQEADQ